MSVRVVDPQQPTVHAFRFSLSKVSPLPASLLEAAKTRSVSLRQQLLATDFLAAGVGLGGSLTAIVESELYFSANEGEEVSRSGTHHNALRAIISVLTAVLLLCVVKRAHLVYEKPWRSCWLYAELLVCAVHWPPFLDATFRFQQLHGSLRLTGDALGGSLMLLRGYLAVRLLGGFSRWMSPRAVEACQDSQCEASVSFAFKCVLHHSPFPLLCLFLLTSVLLFGAALRTFERPYSLENPIGQDFSFYWNSMWLAVVSMTTVGYGDFYPRTHLGRIVAVLASLTGIFLVSMLVVTLNSYTQFSNGQGRVYEFTGPIRTMVKSAERIVAISGYIRVLQRRKEGTAGLTEKKWAEIREELARFSRLRCLELPVRDQLGLMRDSIALWEETWTEQWKNVQTAVSQLEEMEKLQAELSALVHKATKSIKTRLRCLPYRLSPSYK